MKTTSNLPLFEGQSTEIHSKNATRKPATPFRDRPTLAPRNKSAAPRDLTMEQLAHAAQQIQRRSVRWANEDRQLGRNKDPLFS